MQPKNENFMDSKTIIAIAISAVFFIGWQAYLGKKYPNMYEAPKEKLQQEKSSVVSESLKNVPTAISTNQPKIEIKPEESKEVKEQLMGFNNQEISFQVSSFGMGLKNIKLLKYKDKDQNPIEIASTSEKSLYSLTVLKLENPISFQMTQPQPGLFVGQADYHGMQIHRELKYDESTKSITNKVKFLNPIAELKEGISISIPEKIHVDQKSSWFFPSYQIQDFFVLSSEKAESTPFNHLKENISVTYPVGQVVSVSSQYFTAALLNKSEVFPEINISTNIEKLDVNANVIYKPLNLNNELNLEQIFYLGPKSIDILKNVDKDMGKVIDFGYFGFLALPLLYLMKFFQTLVGNWGFAIILLTLTVRVIVLPFNIMSIRSSKAMQKVQPLLTSIREKYKDDPLTLNKEMMSVMKQNGANPIGGCLPALLQIPIFLALYRVIGSSVELYQSPFVAWIGDLSSHDQYYVLPVLMGLTMFIQQKITPTPMDPVQAKVLAFLPIIMSLFMLQLPSGLTLYMFVSALFGIIQQYILMRDKNKTA